MQYRLSLRFLDWAGVLLGVLGLVVAFSAHGADLPSRKAAPAFAPLPVISVWAGPYVGLTAGGVWAHQDARFSTGLLAVGPGDDYAFSAARGVMANSGLVSANPAGFIGGLKAGYNWQPYDKFVVGLEADFSGVAGGNSAGNVAAAVPLGYNSHYVGSMSFSESLNYVGTVRGRVGYLVTPSVLVYGTGGFAYAGVNTNVSTTLGLSSPWAYLAPVYGSAPVSTSTLRTGWTAGGGAEWKFAPNWSVNVEYLYTDLGRKDYNLSPIGQTISYGGSDFGPVWSGATHVSSALRTNTVRAGINYHFDLNALPTRYW